MSDHLPECVSRNEDYGIEFVCICPALRACEERVWDEAYANGYNHGTAHGELHACSLSYEHGYKQGVQAAREAVAASSDHYELCICDECCGTAAALAAIDALKENK